MTDRIISYAQNKEDIILSAFFDENKPGYYVDIGAYDPLLDSVTQYFYQRGWNGINVEPNPERLKLFVSARPRDININAAISNNGPKTKLRIYSSMDGLSTINRSQIKLYENDKEFQAEYKDIEVRTVKLSALLAEHSVGVIDFLKVDVEGHEYQVLESNDWSKFRPKVLCIEANHINHDWRSLLQKNGYEKIFFDGLNEYYIESSNTEIKSKFNYVQSMIGREIISYETSKTITTLESEASTHRSTIESLLQKNNKLLQYSIALETTLEDSKRLKNQIKGVFRAADNAVTVRLINLAKNRYKHYQLNTLTNEEDLVALLGAAHEIDTNTYANPRKSATAKVAVDAMQFLYLRLKNIAKIGVKVIKKMKKFVRGQNG